MKHPAVTDFPELQRVFAGYLHEDFPEEHGTAAAAIRAFYADAGEFERHKFKQEARRFLEPTRPLDFEDVKVLVGRLGSRWMPASRTDLESVLNVHP